MRRLVSSLKTGIAHLLRTASGKYWKDALTVERYFWGAKKCLTREDNATSTGLVQSTMVANAMAEILLGWCKRVQRAMVYRDAGGGSCSDPVRCEIGSGRAAAGKGCTLRFDTFGGGTLGDGTWGGDGL